MGTLVGSYDMVRGQQISSLAQDEAAAIHMGEKEGLVNDIIEQITGVNILDEHRKNGPTHKIETIIRRIDRQIVGGPLGSENYLLDGRVFLHFERLEFTVSVIDNFIRYSYIQRYEVIPWKQQ